MKPCCIILNFLLFGLCLSAEGWRWHGSFPWVYSNVDRSWEYWKAGSNDNFYVFKNLNSKWYYFNNAGGIWGLVVGDYSSINASMTDEVWEQKYNEWQKTLREFF